jgi:hypothetical protein
MNVTLLHNPCMYIGLSQITSWTFFLQQRKASIARWSRLRLQLIRVTRIRCLWDRLKLCTSTFLWLPRSFWWIIAFMITVTSILTQSITDILVSNCNKSWQLKLQMPHKCIHQLEIQYWMEQIVLDVWLMPN